ncbi:unnamed protein product [Owenia fusiformis]|uniref:Kinase n=1 Tax=Owenia fusiformis TaxID=6347 RepID=A0A8S4MZ41_OWEFU|nr:unnamed protein product [Owenia fusiformis]
MKIKTKEHINKRDLRDTAEENQNQEQAKENRSKLDNRTSCLQATCVLCRRDLCGSQQDMSGLATGEARDSVQLEPFMHQVGGHSSMLLYNDTTVCKPYIPREHHLYQTLPSAMGHFIPEYRGLIEVSSHEDQDGYITLVGHPIELPRKGKHYEDGGCSPGSSGEGEARSDSDSEISPIRQTSRSRVRVRQSGSIEVEARSRDIANGTHNPWSLQCHKEQLAKMRKAKQGSGQHKFILLENVVSQFTYPCILDLKMGTRQHGDDASEEKKRSQILKCEASTSCAIGVRICGMQIYQCNSDTYLRRNKYHGRKLTVDGFKETLRQFLYSGNTFLSELVEPIIRQLRRMLEILKEQHTFRFYSSSLLIIYDAKDIVKFREKVSNDSEHESAKTGKGSRPASAEDVDMLSVESIEIDQHSESPGTSTGSSNSLNIGASTHSNREPHVDIRMIDFAHTTHQGLRDKKLHDGPDLGYMFGLENLIRMFTEIRDNHKP